MSFRMTRRGPRARLLALLLVAAPLAGCADILGDDEGDGAKTKNGEGDGTDQNVTQRLNEPPMPVIRIVSDRDPANETRTAFLGEGLFFSAAGSTDADGVIRAYKWEFVEGGSVAFTSTDVDVKNYQFQEPGAKTIRLTVTDDQGAAETAVETFYRNSVFSEEGSIAYEGPITAPKEGTATKTFPVVDLVQHVIVIVDVRQASSGRVVVKDGSGKEIGTSGEIQEQPGATEDAPPTRTITVRADGEGSVGARGDYTVQVTLTHTPPEVEAGVYEPETSATETYLATFFAIYSPDVPSAAGDGHAHQH